MLAAGLGLIILILNCIGDYMSNCVHCGKPIILVPSAEERAKKCFNGYSAKYYRNLFKEHSECQVAKWYDRPLPPRDNSGRLLNADGTIAKNY